MLMSYKPMWAEPLNVQDNKINKINKSLLKLSTTLLKKTLLFTFVYIDVHIFLYFKDRVFCTKRSSRCHSSNFRVC